MSQPLGLRTYRRLEHREHIMQRPWMYLGSLDPTPRSARVLAARSAEGSESTLALVETTITTPIALEHTFREILTNAVDNAKRSRDAGIDPGSIDVQMDDQWITVRNYGLPIDLYLDPDEAMWTPELIFGVLMTSSTFGSDLRTGAGVNGYGAKLTNLYASHFEVDAGSQTRGVHYHQTWDNNMGDRSDPLIDQAYTGPSYTQIRYRLDFPRFNCPGYDTLTQGLFARHTVDIAATMKISTSFNGMTFAFPDIKTYARLLFGDAVDRSFVHQTPTMELVVVDTPSAGCVISSVNNMVTNDGGVHVDAAWEALGPPILELINQRGRTKSKGPRKQPVLTMKDLKPHLSLIVTCHLVNPILNAQIKSRLDGPIPSITIPERLLKMVLNWTCIERLQATLEAKLESRLAKSDGSKKRRVTIEKAEDANYAGGPESTRCTLFLTEGDSALGYFTLSLNVMPGGRDYNGAYPLRGKPLNAMNTSLLKLSDNKEFNELNEILGLRRNVDYTQEENYRRLRYGFVVLLFDADEDGTHIIALILNWAYRWCPSLLARGYFLFLRTPVIRAFRGGDVKKFYTMSEFQAWREQAETEAWRIKYYKGLGTSRKDEVIDDMMAPRSVVCVYDDQAPEMFRLAFDKHLTNQRKVWLADYQPALGIEQMQMQPISDFLRHELVRFSRADVERSIPDLLSGLKESQTKIIWGAHRKWGAKLGLPGAEEFKIARFANAIAEATDYHHDENCLADAIMVMTRDFVGSNNMPYFTKDGQLGTRNLNGNDAASSRYTYTRPQWWLPFIYRPDDAPLLTYLDEQGRVVDLKDKHNQGPVRFLPIIPMILVNGAEGIGTAWSTLIPKHHPLDLVKAIRARLRGEPLPTLFPWYRGFKGLVELITRPARVRPVEPEPSDSDDEPDPLGDDHVLDPPDDPTEPLQAIQTTPTSVRTTGVFTTTLSKDHQRRVTITELPIGRGMHQYKVWCERLREEKKITDFLNRSLDEEVHFILEGLTFNPTRDSLRLTRTFGLTNMTALDPNKHPVHYPDVTTLFNAWFDARYPYYLARRQYRIDTITGRVHQQEDRIRFITAVRTKTLKYKDRKLVDVYHDMEQLHLPIELLKSTSLSAFTEEELERLRNDIAVLEEERRTIEQTPPEELWLRDLDAFEAAYHRHYPDEEPRPTGPLVTVRAGNHFVTSYTVRRRFRLRTRS